ncbi:MAG TPA: hypothetical protein VF532_18360 [Candidatus Angelobacter sp.]
MLLPLGRAMLMSLYLVIAVATEAVIVANLLPQVGLILGLNIVVAGLASEPSFGRASLQVSAAVGIVTFIVRFSVAAFSLWSSKIGVQRFAAALVGGTLFLTAVQFMYNFGELVYENYYLYPKFKEGYIMPKRWQDFAWLVELVCEILLLLYISYRLLKYASRAKTAGDPGAAGGRRQTRNSPDSPRFYR